MERTRLGFGRLILVILATALLVPAPGALAAKAKKVNLNTASVEELEALPGIGAATAKKIVDGRPYSSVNDLERAGVSKSTISKISSQVTATGGAAAAENPAKSARPAKAEKTEKAPAKTETAAKSEKPAAASSGEKVDVNGATESDLEALPGVGAATAKKIVDGRPYHSVHDLARAGVSQSTIDKISPLVKASHARSSASARAPASEAAPASTSASAARASAAPGAPAASSRSAESAQAAKGSPGKGMVWVNTESKIYHFEGDRWYGKTREGRYMSEQDAIKAGYRAAKTGSEEQ